MKKGPNTRQWMKFIRETGSFSNGRLVRLMAASIGFSVFSALSVSLLLPFVNLIFATSPMPALYPTWMIGSENRFQWLTVVCGSTWIMFALKNAFFVMAGRMSSAIVSDAAQGIRTRVMERMTRLEILDLQLVRTGTVMEQLFNGAQELAEKSAAVLGGSARYGILVSAYLFILLWLDPFLMMLSLLMAPLVSVAGHAASRRLRPLSEQRAQAMANLIHRVQERLHTMKLIRILNGESFERERFEKDSRLVSTVQRKRETVDNVGLAAAEMAGVSAGLLLLLFLGLRSLSGSFTHGPGGLILFVAAVFSLIDPMRHLLRIRSELAECVALTVRLEKASRPLPLPTVTSRIARFDSTIEWHQVGFSYSPSGRPILKDCDLVIHKGEKIALFGSSGIGKTTFVDLMLGLYPPENGHITLDNIPLHTIALEDRSRLFGVMTQDAYIFSDTIRNNVVYNRTEVADRDVWDVLEHVQLGDWVRQKQDGLHERLVERGQNMSGGERQRLALARILFRRPEILILDEATSALDLETEKAILTLLSTLFQSQTVLFVSHRESVLGCADRRLELRGGFIYETGPS